jgi:hypothetical protein
MQFAAMKSYLEQIQDLAAILDVSLLQAFKVAEIPTSTYYRTINGDTELRHETAKKVMVALGKLHALQGARKDTEQLRAAGKRVNISTARARFKSRELGPSHWLHLVFGSQVGDSQENPFRLHAHVLVGFPWLRN